MIEDPHIQHLFDVLCSAEGERDYGEVKIVSLDNNRGSVISSMMGSLSSGDHNSPVLDDVGDVDNRDTYDKPDWETLNETERESNIANTLKQLRNIKKDKLVSPLILKDMLGADADALGNHIVKKSRKNKTS